MKLLSWLITLPIIAVIASFVFSNRAEVTLTFWPFDYQFMLPVYAVALLSLFVGVIMGAVIAWIGTLRYRFEARRLRKELAARENVIQTVLPPEKVKDEKSSLLCG